MKKAVIVSFGLVFFPLGFLLNAWMQSNAIPVQPLWLVSIGALAVWFGLGRLASRLAAGSKSAVVLGNSIPFTVLLLLLFQEWILGAYWQNIAGTVGQLYYLSLLRLAFMLTPMFRSMPPTYITAFLLLCAAFWLGIKTARNRK